MELDDDVVPVVNALNDRLTELEAALCALFDPAVLNEETIPEKLTLEEQANFANVSAFALATCLYGMKKVDGQLVDAQLLEKIIRVKDYANKVRRAGEVSKRPTTRSSGKSATSRATAGKKRRTGLEGTAESVAEQSKAELQLRDRESDDSAKQPKLRPTVNKEVVRRLTRL